MGGGLRRALRWQAAGSQCSILKSMEIVTQNEISSQLAEGQIRGWQSVRSVSSHAEGLAPLLSWCLRQARVAVTATQTGPLTAPRCPLHGGSPPQCSV